MVKGWQDRVQEIKRYNSKKRRSLDDFNKPPKKGSNGNQNNDKEHQWAILVVATEGSFTPDKLVGWASRKGLLYYNSVRLVSEELALALDKALLQLEEERKKVKEPNSGSRDEEDWDFYRDLGY